MNYNSTRKATDLVGIGYMLASCCFYALVNCLVKILGTHISSYNIAFFRYLFSLVTLVPFLLMAKGNFKEDIKSFNIYNVLRAGISFLSMTWFAAGLAGTPLNKAMSLTFITPVFMSLIGIIWLKEKSTIEKWTAIFIGLLGGIIIENPFGGFNYSSLYIIGACVLWAITGMVMKILSQRQDPITITFYMSLLTVPISLPYFIYDPYLPNPKECIIMLMLGFFYNLAQITATKAYQLTQLTVVAPFDFLRMILGIILGYMFFDEVVSDNTIFGSILVILGTTLVAGKEIHKLSTRSKS